MQEDVKVKLQRTGFQLTEMLMLSKTLYDCKCDNGCKACATLHMTCIQVEP